MAENFFFNADGKGEDRKVWLKGITLVPGKGKSKGKQIRLKLVMALTSEPMRGMPAWMADAFEFVTRTADPVFPDYELAGVDTAFAADMLFGSKAVQAPGARLRGFSVEQFRLPGAKKDEGPTVAAIFTLLVPFSDALCRWTGQMLGTEVYARFTPATGSADAPPPLLAGTGRPAVH